MAAMVAQLMLTLAFSLIFPVPGQGDLREELDVLVEALRSDKVRHNAKEALSELERRIEYEPKTRPQIRSRLEAALDQDDHQLRQAAACLLAHLYQLDDLQGDQ